MSDVWEWAKYLGLLLLLMVGIVVVATAMNMVFGGSACNSLADFNPDYEFQFEFWNGCLVKAPNGRWVSVSSFPYIQGELELKGDGQ